MFKKIDKKKRIEQISIDVNYTLAEALKTMDKSNVKLLLVLNKSKLISLLSIGDIQRAILNGKPLNDLVGNNLRASINVAYEYEEIESIKKRMLEERDEYMPIVNSTFDLIDVIFWEELFTSHKIKKINIPVVIMAGGFGTRLKPLTNVIPKPLIPYNESTLLENIIISFNNAGCKQFFLLLNYRAELIQFYINKYFSKKEVYVNSFIENKPLGTAGGLSLIQNKIRTTFFLSNCDIIIKHNYYDIYEFHKSNNNALTMVTSLKSINIPYGTVTINEEGLIKEIIEKPEYQHWINTGFYVLEPIVFNYIKENCNLGMNSLIEDLIADKKNVGMFPLNENSWEDMGEWNDYRKYLFN